MPDLSYVIKRLDRNTETMTRLIVKVEREATARRNDNKVTRETITRMLTRCSAHDKLLDLMKGKNNGNGKPQLNGAAVKELVHQEVGQEIVKRQKLIWSTFGRAWGWIPESAKTAIMLGLLYYLRDIITGAINLFKAVL